jgi:hypothetical protein
MNDFDEIAERFQDKDGQPLVDHLPLALPCYLLQMDCLMSERRKLMPVEEYLLRGLKVGLKSNGDLLNFIGVDIEYGNRLIERLIADELIGGVEGNLGIRSKGDLMLTEDGEKRIYERTIPLLWDPILEVTIPVKVELIRSLAVRNECRVRVIPQSANLPALDRLPLDSAQAPAFQNPEREKVIRYLGVQRRTLMYRRGLLLLYGGVKGAEPIARIAVQSIIDDAYSDAFTKKGLLPRLGVDNQFNRRLGALAVDQRVKPLGISATKASLSDLLRLRSTLQLGVAALEKMADEQAAKKIEEKRLALSEIQTKLDAMPIRQLLPFELPRVVEHVFQKARDAILITTTVPLEARLTALRLLLLEQALRKGVKVRILISNRPTDDELSQNEGPIPLLKRLSDLMARYDSLEVSFLRDTNRVVYEVAMDNTLLAVSNEPPLGSRTREPLARNFSGYVLSGAVATRAYQEAHLSTEALAVVGRIRFAPTKAKSIKNSPQKVKHLK